MLPLELDPKIFLVIPLQLIIMLAYFPIARRLKLYDVPNERSSHKYVTYRGGGIIFPLSLVLYLIFIRTNDYYWIAAVLLVSLISFYDDFKGANVLLRLMVHFIALGLLLTPLIEYFYPTPNLFFIMLIAVVGVAAVNAYNFMDGINAITGLYTLTVYEFIFYYVIVIDTNPENLFNLNVLIILTISLLIFGFYNFRTRAVIFAGDVGSVSLGMISVYYVSKLILRNDDIIYLSLLSVYGVESGLTILYRLYKRQNIFQAHRMHLFQDLVNKVGLSHLTTSLLYAALQVVINFLLIVNLKNEYIEGYYFFAFVVMMLVGLYIILKYYIHQRYNLETENEKN